MLLLLLEITNGDGIYLTKDWERYPIVKWMRCVKRKDRFAKANVEQFDEVLPGHKKCGGNKKVLEEMVVKLYQRH